MVDTDWTQFVDLTEPLTLSAATLESMTNEYKRIYILGQYFALLLLSQANIPVFQSAPRLVEYAFDSFDGDSWGRPVA